MPAGGEDFDYCGVGSGSNYVPGWSSAQAAIVAASLANVDQAVGWENLTAVPPPASPPPAPSPSRTVRWVWNFSNTWGWGWKFLGYGHASNGWWGWGWGWGAPGWSWSRAS